MNTVSILCFVSLVAGIHATGYNGVKAPGDNSLKWKLPSRPLSRDSNGVDEKSEANRRAAERLRKDIALAKVNVNAQKILKALKIDRDTRQAGRACLQTGEWCLGGPDMGTCCPGLVCDKNVESYSGCRGCMGSCVGKKRGNCRGQGYNCSESSPCCPGLVCGTPEHCLMGCAGVCYPKRG